MWTKTLTTAGIALLSRVAEGKIIFTKAHAGAGQISNNQLVNAISVNQYMRDFTITQITSKPSAVSIRLNLNNVSLSLSFDMYQIGLYAKVDGDASDVLMYMMQSDTAEYVPSEAESQHYVSDYLVQLNISQTNNISAEIDPAGMVTIGQFNNALTNKLDKTGDSSNTVVTRVDPAVSEKYPALSMTSKLSDIVGKTVRWLTSIKADKVDKVTGKGLSTNDFTHAYQAKLTGIADNANKYVHPSTHPASMITQDSARRMVSDVQIDEWNGKASTTHNHNDTYYTKSEVGDITLIRPSTYEMYLAHPNRSQINGDINNVTFPSKLFIYNLKSTPITNSRYGWLDTDYSTGGGFVPSGYGNIIQTFRAFENPTISFSRKATKSANGSWTWGAWQEPNAHTHDRREFINYRLMEKNINEVDNQTNYVVGINSASVNPFSGGAFTNVVQFACNHFITQLAFHNNQNLIKVRNRYASDAQGTAWQTVYTERSITVSESAPTAFLGEGFQHQKY